MFFKLHGYKSKRAFAKRMGIKEQSVNKYLNGIYDPMNLSVKLAEDGCNIQWLATGQKPDIPKPLSGMDRLMLKMLKSNGIDNPQKLEQFLNTQHLENKLQQAVHDTLAKYSPTKKTK